MIARGGMPFVAAPALAIAAFLAASLAISSNMPTIVSTPFAVLLIGFLVFFRDPPRSIGRGVVSPADGRVIEANPASGHVAIYMSMLDVHVNRAPWSGTVVSQKVQPGGHSSASSPEAADNYSVSWILETLIGKVHIRQVAGLFARRIVPYVDSGARVKKGQRIGLIRFGSRVEVTLPQTMRIVVKDGDRVRAGETTIAEVRHESRDQ